MAGNKNDLIGKQQVNDKDAIKFAEDNNIIFGQTSAAKNKSSVDSLLDKLIIKYLENSNPSLAEGNNEEARIKLDAKTNTEPKKESCSFFKNLFKSKKKEEKKVEKKMWSFISKPNDKKATQKIKISVVGDVNVGKTNLCKVLFNEKYIENSEVEKKNNIVYNKTLCYNDKYFDAEIIDFAKGEGDAELFKNSDIIICLYVLNNEGSYNELINYWYPFIKKNNGNKNAIVGIAENKNDLKNEGGVEFDVDIEKSNDDIKQALEVNNDIIFEKISCKSNLNVIKFFQRIVTKFIEIKK